MVTLIIQNTFEPYYAGKKRFTAPASEPVSDAAVPDESGRALLMRKRQRVRLLQARLTESKPSQPNGTGSD